MKKQGPVSFHIELPDGIIVAGTWTIFAVEPIPTLKQKKAPKKQ